MNTIENLLRELDQEAITTRKMLAIVPNDQLDWQPHRKSMTVRQLATHIAELPSWITIALTTEELDFAVDSYTPTPIDNHEELLATFESNLTAGRAQLATATEQDLAKSWTMRNGETIYFTQSAGEVIRMTYSQIVHHRAQLGVYLRLLDIPIPGSYGPSADEQEMVFESTL